MRHAEQRLFVFNQRRFSLRQADRLLSLTHRRAVGRGAAGRGRACWSPWRITGRGAGGDTRRSTVARRRGGTIARRRRRRERGALRARCLTHGRARGDDDVARGGGDACAGGLRRVGRRHDVVIERAEILHLLNVERRATRRQVL